ncbi:MAG TPA: RraA family protein [Thermodesulfobacteriota bacterium]|nr:RraA family protein [Thermodesulfobacteriota bacterium]
MKIPEKYRQRLMGLIPVERIVTWKISRPSKTLLQALLGYDGLTPTLSDILDSMGIVGAIPGSVLRPVLSGKKIAGPAVTLKYVPERLAPAQSFQEKAKAKLAERDAYALTEPGDVVVIDGGSRGDISAMGGLSTLMAKKYGLAGNIVDCGVRDVGEMRNLDYPVWSRGVTPITGKFRFEALEVNGPVVCAGVSVHPGDLVVADDTGVVIIPQRVIHEVVQRAIEASKKETILIGAIEEGSSMAEMKKILAPEKW